MPAYERVVRGITARIESGEWPVGTQLPTKLELQKMFAASKSAVDTAMIVLRERGIVRGEQGRGVFVAGARRRRPDHTEEPS